MSKVWIITGTSSGLGRELAIAALARGDRVVATARRPEQLADIVAGAPERARAVKLDVTSADDIGRAVGEATLAFGRVDVLVNNAGYGLVGALEELGDEQIRQNFESCLFGPIYLMRAVLPIMRNQRAGHIINISAAAAIANYPGFAVYGAAKCGLEGASEAVALEAAPLGIKVTIVQPGPFRTDFVSRSLARGEHPIADYDASSGKFIALLNKLNGSQPGDPSKAASAIVALAESEKPPLRLVLGKYAYNKSRKRLRDASAELDAWEAVGLPTDF